MQTVFTRAWVSIRLGNCSSDFDFNFDNSEIHFRLSHKFYVVFLYWLLSWLQLQIGLPRILIKFRFVQVAVCANRLTYASRVQPICIDVPLHYLSRLIHSLCVDPNTFSHRTHRIPLE